MAEESRASAVRRAHAVARVMDRAIAIPGTGIRVGLDSLIGIVPGIGDAIGVALSGYIVMLAAKQGVSRPVLARMVSNIVIDGVAGVVPLVGDMFDVAWKANTRNAALLERELEIAVTPQTRRGSGAIVWAMLAGCLLVVGILVYLVARVVWRILSSA